MKPAISLNLSFITTLLLAALPLCSANAAVPLPDLPPVPSVERMQYAPPDLLSTWGAPEYLRAWARSTASLQKEARNTASMRSQQETYNSVKPSVFDLLRVDTVIDIDLEQTDYLEVATDYTLTTVDNPVGNISFIRTLEEVVEVVSTTHLITYNLTGDYIKITFEPPLPLGEVAHLRIVAKGAPNSLGESMLPTIRLKGDIWYATHSRFMPMKNDNSDVFQGNMVLRVKGSEPTACGAGGTGKLVDVRMEQDGSRKIFTFEHSHLTGLYAFALSKFLRIESGTKWNTAVVVNAFYEPSAGPLLGLMDDILDSYSQWYHPYLWGKLDAVQMPNSFSGGFGPLSTIMCYQSSFALDDDGGTYGPTQLFSHEIGHQWWGNMVEMADESSVYLSEGMAEFSSNLYFEKVFNSRWTFVSNNMAYIYTVNHDVEPSIISPFVYNSQYYYQIAYQKGACIGDMLRTELGEELLLDGLRVFMERYAQNFARVEDLFEVLEEVSGRSLQQFYDQWVLGRGHPRLFVASGYNREDQTTWLEIRQEPGTEFTLTLPVRLELPDGTFQEVMVPVEGPVTTFSLPMEQPPVRVQFDHRRKQLRRLVPLVKGDLDGNGTLDGRDLVEFSFAYGTDIVYGSGTNNYFIPNWLYDELADFVGTADPAKLDGMVNDSDYDVLMERLLQ